VTVLVVAWVLALLSIFSLSFNHEARTELRLSRLDVEAVQARGLARSGLRLAEELAREAAAQDATASGQKWESHAVLRRVALGSGYFSVGRREGDEAAYGIVDENRLLPLQVASREILFRLPGLDEATVEALLRYRENVSGTGFPPLAAVPGLEPEIRDRVAGYVTSYPAGGVNINTTSRAILEALGISASTVERILARRNGRDGEAGTADDEPFTTLLTPDGGLADLGLSDEEAAAVSILAREEILVTRSDVFRARSRGWVEGSRRYCELEEVIRVTPERLEILDWRERWRS